MTEIFNKAYDQANQILDGSGLSSVIHKQEGGSFNIYDRALEAGKRYYQSLPSTAKFYLQQFQDKPMTDSEVKKTSTKSEINELIKAIERNQVSPKDDQTIPGPIYDKNGNILFDPEGEVTWDTPGYSKIDNQSFSDLFPGDPLFNLQNTMGKFYYGPANLAGEREIYDVYDWEKGDEKDLQGLLGMIAKAYNDFKGREGRTISFTVNPYKDQWKFNPETGEHINPEDPGPSQQNDAWDDMGDWAMSDAASSFKHGGKITSGGLAGIKKSININGQPHKLAWINSDEASALKAMGGSGKPGPMGIPSYQWGDYPDELSEDQDDKSGSTDTSNAASSADTTETAGSVSGPGYADFTPPSADEWASAVAAEEIESEEFFKTTAENLAKLGKEAAKSRNEETVNKYIAGVISLAQNKYNINPIMSNMFDWEAAEVLNRLAVEYNLPVWGIGMHSGDDLGANEPLHYWQYSGYVDEEGTKIPGADVLARRGHYGGKDSPFAEGLASLVRFLFFPGGNVIKHVSDKTNKGYGIANPDDPLYWSKDKRSLKNALKAIEDRPKKSFVDLGKEIINMYKLGSDDTTKKEGDDEDHWGISGFIGPPEEPEATKDKDRIATYDDFWKDLEDNVDEGNEPRPIKKKKLLPPPLPAESEEEELTGMTALLAKRPEATSRQDSNVYLGELLNQIYGGEGIGQSMLG